MGYAPWCTAFRKIIGLVTTMFMIASGAGWAAPSAPPIPSAGAVTLMASDVPRVIPDPGQIVSTLNVPTAGTIVDAHIVFQFTAFM